MNQYHFSPKRGNQITTAVTGQPSRLPSLRTNAPPTSSKVVNGLVPADTLTK